MVLISNEPNRVYPALVLALGATAMGSKVKVYCAMNGLDVIRKGGADKIQMPGLPPLSKFFKDAMDVGVEFIACAPSREFLAQVGITEETVEKGVKLEDVIPFLNESLAAAKKGGIVFFI
ncbi:MAG: DsrE/DsrF/DrsH-like family protein [Nitrososphaerales archaeon]